MIILLYFSTCSCSGLDPRADGLRLKWSTILAGRSQLLSPLLPPITYPRFLRNLGQVKLESSFLFE